MSIMRHGLRTQPALLVRGSSRRIMSMRFRPANISVINRRDSTSAVIGPAVPNRCSKPTSGIMFPLRRPSPVYRVPQRCSQSRVRFAAPQKRRALDCCAPFRPSGYRDGRLRREHETIFWENQKPRPTKTSAPNRA